MSDLDMMRRILGGNVAAAINRARTTNQAYCFDYNGVMVTVMPDSDPALIARDVERAFNGCITEVDPYPEVTLSDEVLAGEAEVQRACEAARRAAEQRQLAADRRQGDVIRARAEAAPPIQLTNEVVWHAALAEYPPNTYLGGAVTYAERLARLLQQEMCEGRKLEDVWPRVASEADLGGLSGGLYGAAIQLLAECWVHGPALLALHSK